MRKNKKSGKRHYRHHRKHRHRHPSTSSSSSSCEESTSKSRHSKCSKESSEDSSSSCENIETIFKSFSFCPGQFHLCPNNVDNIEDNNRDLPSVSPCRGQSNKDTNDDVDDESEEAPIISINNTPARIKPYPSSYLPSQRKQPKTPYSAPKQQPMPYYISQPMVNKSECPSKSKLNSNSDMQIIVPKDARININGSNTNDLQGKLSKKPYRRRPRKIEIDDRDLCCGYGGFFIIDKDIKYTEKYTACEICTGAYPADVYDDNLRKAIKTVEKCLRENSYVGVGSYYDLDGDDVAINVTFGNDIKDVKQFGTNIKSRLPLLCYLDPKKKFKRSSKFKKLRQSKRKKSKKGKRDDSSSYSSSY